MKSLTIYWNALTEGFWAAKCAFEMVFADRLKNPDKPHLCIATCRRMDDEAEHPASLSSLSRTAADGCADANPEPVPAYESEPWYIEAKAWFDAGIERASV
jgi:hypothetical protein